MFARKAGSVLDRLASCTGDPFHHVGVVLKCREPVVVEFTFRGCEWRTVREFIDHYDEVGVVRTGLSVNEQQRVHRAAKNYLGIRPRYAWDEMFVTGLSGLIRDRTKTKESFERGARRRSLEAAVDLRNRGGHRGAFCTSFVTRVLADAGVATQELLGPLAPPDGHEFCDFGIKPVDRTMRWTIPAQIIFNLWTLALLVIAAARNPIPSIGEPLAIGSPSDYWRHIAGQQKLSVVDGQWFVLEDRLGDRLAPGANQAS